MSYSQHAKYYNTCEPIAYTQHENCYQTPSINHSNNEAYCNIGIEKTKNIVLGYKESLKEAFSVFLPLGLFTFSGGVGVIQQRFVDQLKWVSNDEFVEMYALAQSLPGPIVCKVLTAISQRRHGFWISLLNLLLFIFPGFVCCLIFGWLMNNYSITAASPIWLINGESGLACAGVGLSAMSAWRVSLSIRKEKGRVRTFVLIMASIVFCVTLLETQLWVLPIMLIVGAIILSFKFNPIAEDMEASSVQDSPENGKSYKYLVMGIV